MKKKTKTLISIAVMIFMICAVNVSFVKAESKVIKVGILIIRDLYKRWMTALMKAMA